MVNRLFSTVISGIEEVAYNAGYNVMICQSNERYDRELSNAQMLYSNRVDGLLVSLSKETKNFSHLKFFQDSNIPVVFFDRSTNAFPSDKVIIDDFKASYEATNYLISRGHKNLIHLAAPQNLAIGVNRKNGFMQAIIDAGLPFSEDQIVLADNFEAGKLMVREILKDNNVIDGIFSANDLTAFGAMQAIKSLNRKIPEDIGVVGFSNGQYSYITEPALTTIDQNGFEMGRIATELLLKRIDSEEETIEPEEFIVATKLVIRHSTK